MKFSTYINNIIEAIFCPNFLIEERETNKKLQKSYENAIKSTKNYADDGWHDAYKYAKQVDELNYQLKVLKRDYENLTNLNRDLKRKLERYYKTGKNSKKT